MEHTKEAVIQYLKENYTEDGIQSDIDEGMRDYLHEDWEEEFDGDVYEAYLVYGNGESEAQVRMQIEKEILEKMYPEYRKEAGYPEDKIFYERYEEEIGESVWETIQEVYSELDK